MSLLVKVPKTQALKINRISDRIAHFCQSGSENDEHFVYVPQPGSVIALLQLFNEHEVPYEFHHGKVKMQ